MSKVQIVNIEERDLSIDTVPLIKEILSTDELKEYEDYKKNSSAKISDYVKNVINKVLKVNNVKSVYVNAILNNAPPEIANALQRASTSEQDHYALNVRYEDVETNDRDMNVRELIDNINLIPIRQGITEQEFLNAEFSIDITNNEMTVEPVMTGDLKIGGVSIRDAIFHPTIELIYLNPHCHLRIKNIRIVKGNTGDHTKFLVASNGVTWPLDRKENTQTSNSTPMKHRISFRVNAVIPTDKNIGKRILRSGAENIIVRLSSLIDMINGEDSMLYFQEYDDHSVLETIETNTIAKMFDRVCYMLYPNISSVTSDICYHSHNMTIVVYATDSKKIILKTLEECIGIYEDIHRQLSK